MSVENLELSRSIVKLRAVVPESAFTAAILGSERIGNGVVINSNGLILTVGYLITEATDVWLTLADGQELPGHALAHDQVTGFGLVLPLEKPDVCPLPIGSSAALRTGDTALVASHAEPEQQPVQVVARREFAGAWEYLLEGAIFTAPAHPHWSGAALIDEGGSLVGVGSLLVRERVAGQDTDANLFVPIDLLKPLLDDLVTRGRANRPPRPWLGVYGVEVAGRIYVTGVAEGGPARLADIREGDIISHIDDRDVTSLADFYRRLWSVGPAGVGVALTIVRGGTSLRVNVRSIDRADLLKRPPAH
ncbi:MAG: S1C family serine protease [Pseudomonadota bacterium]|nr:S1C family serine protease [Pseudomonadota bacterium]